MRKTVFVFSFMLLCSVVCQSVMAQDKYEVTSQSKLNVRSLPGVDSWVLGAISPKEQILVYRIDDGWAEIRYNNQKAYVSAKYIREVDDTAEDNYGTYKVISQSRLNVRNRPSTESQVLGVLQPAEQIEVLSIEGQWAKIQYKSNVGYVALRYIERVEQQPKVVEEEVVIVPVKKEVSTPKIVDEPQKRRSKGVSLKNVGIELVPNLSIGYANFTCSSAYPVPRMGLGIDCALQFIAEEKISFIPKDYFTEVSLGYSMRGSGAFPMHYFNIKLMPFGYRLVLDDYTFFGKLGVYAGLSASEIDTHYNHFYTNPDMGISVGLGFEMYNIGVGLSFEQGFIDVCDANLSLKNQCLFVNLSYRLLDIKKGTFNIKKEKVVKHGIRKRKSLLRKNAKKMLMGSSKKNV